LQDNLEKSYRLILENKFDMEDKFELLKDNEIISLEDSVRILLQQPTYKVIELKRALIPLVQTTTNRWTQDKANWFSQGVPCEVLRLDAKGWRKGKVRLAIEFLPDEPEVEEIPATNEIEQPESPLDDLRQMINQETQQ
jgi:hypothetical protein